MRRTHRSAIARRQWSKMQRAREGFTLIEVLLALTILSGVVLTMAMNTTLAGRKVSNSGTRSRAQAIVDQQIARARTWPAYGSLNQLSAPRYNPGVNGLTTSTVVALDTTSGKNITTIKVTVTGTTTAVLATPIVRSISIAAP